MPARQYRKSPKHCCSNVAPHIIQDTTLAQITPVGSTRSQLRIAQMDCPTEEALIRKKLGAMQTVQGLNFNLMQQVLTITHTQNALPDIEAAIRSLGMTPEPITTTTTPHALPCPSKPGWLLFLAGLTAVVAEITHSLGFPVWLIAMLALVSVSISGLETYKKGLIALRSFNFNINALMSIAVTGALFLGQWPEAAMVMFLFIIAERIEAKSLDRARNAIQNLMQLAPEKATVLQPDGSWKELDAASITVNATVRVRPGERIALDGVIIAGHSTVNQAAITGESLSIDKAEGDRVFAGSMNEAGSFSFRVTATANHTTLAKIIHTVQEAQSVRAPTQRFVDLFAKFYTPAVLSIAIIIALAPPLLMGQAWYDWSYKALVLLVIACPCALVISTPVTIVSGLAAAARQGILVKGGVYLEQGRKLSWLALDKTGTITYGHPVQTDFELCGKYSEPEVLKIALSLTAHSDHPVSKAITQAGEQTKTIQTEVIDFKNIPGQGIQGVIGGTLYQMGNHHLIETLKVCSPALEARRDKLEQQGKTTLMLTDGKTVLALFAVADTVRETSKAAIHELHALGIQTLMLTGDNAHTASAIAAQVGIDQAHGNQLPEDKANAILAKRNQGLSIGMVGDGINDAPALAHANIGFAMGAAGSDTAIETADIALMDDDLRKIPLFIRLSQRTYCILVQNIVLALGIKALFIGLTLTGTGTMWMAVFADMGASLLVVFNGLRLLRK